MDLDSYRGRAGTPGALVLGYGNLDDAGVDDAVTAPAAAIRAA